MQTVDPGNDAIHNFIPVIGWSRTRRFEGTNGFDGARGIHDPSMFKGYELA